MSTPTTRDIRFIVGIDEAGRGPLAGPVSVGAVVVPFKTKHPLFKVAKDSKMLSPTVREEIFKKIRLAKKEGTLDYRVSLVSAKIIDEKGIVFAIRTAMKRTLRKLNVLPHQTMVILDGSLYAPDQFLFQETIIGGDDTEPLISLASIAAKVTRDKKMMRLAKEYPKYEFDVHKGYGTSSHIKKIKKFGPSEIHRRIFIRNI